MNRTLCLIAVILLLPGCTYQNTTEVAPESSNIATLESFAVDVLAITPQELQISSSETFVGKVSDVILSRSISYAGEEASLWIVALRVKVTSVLEGGAEVGQVRVVELLPGTQHIATELRSVILGKEVVIYGQASPELESQDFELAQKETLPLLQMSSPYGVIISVPDERRLIWPLLSELTEGVLKDVLPGGSIMSGSSFGFED